jgi:hypothetical protein
VFRSVPPTPAFPRWPLTDVAALGASVLGMAVAAPLINDISGVGALAIALWRNLYSVSAFQPAVCEVAGCGVMSGT